MSCQLYRVAGKKSGSLGKPGGFTSRKPENPPQKVSAFLDFHIIKTVATIAYYFLFDKVGDIISSAFSPGSRINLRAI